MNLTPNEIVKALEDWIKNYEGTFGNFRTLGNVLNLINCLQTRVDDLERNDLPRCKDALRRANEIGKELQAENERLKEENNELHKALTNAECNYDNMRLLYINKKVDVDRLLIANAEIQVTAYKEFAERLKEEKHICLPPIGYPVDEDDWVIYEDDIDNILKELMGENNA